MTDETQAGDKPLAAALGAFGSMDALYRHASTKFNYSEYLEQEKAEAKPIADKSRLDWLADMITWLETKHAYQVGCRAYPMASQTRQEIGRLLAEMRVLLDKQKKES